MTTRRMLHISPDLSLPLSAVTSTTVVYGGKGMGKTNFGAVLVEELSGAGLRWSVLDPMGVWWGMRHSADGKGSGVECLILGGAHGDIPIEPTGGAVIADLVADETVNVIIDISRNGKGEMWSIGERIKFATDYGKQLFRRQGSLVDGQRREPICQVVDEAARFIPQMVRAGDVAVAMCAGVWSAIVEEGRNIGLGVVLLTQRSARLSKDVAELADLMMAFRTVGPNSIDAVIDWLGAHLPKPEIKSKIEIVRSLPVGSCLAVSPGWLETEKVIRIRRRNTFDSSATPKPGEKAARVRGDGAKPDLDVYAKRMRETIERAAADDPKMLRKRIAELEAAAAKKPKEDGKAMSDLLQQVEELRTKAAEADRLRQLLQDLQTELTREEALRKGTADALRHAADAVQACARLLEDGSMEAARIASQPMAPLRRAQPDDGVTAAAMRVASVPVPKQPTAASRAPVANQATDDGERLTPARQKILDALAMGQSMGRARLSRMWIAILVKASQTSSSFGNNLGALRSAGLIDYQGGEVMLTDAGLGRANPAPRLSQTEALTLLLNYLTPARRKIMEVLLPLGGDAIARDKLAEAVNASPTSSSFGNNLGALRSLGMIDYPTSGQVHARAELFLERR
jgi:Fe2+ or Zn2+ uptake regulation protein